MKQLTRLAIALCAALLLVSTGTDAATTSVVLNLAQQASGTTNTRPMPGQNVEVRLILANAIPGANYDISIASEPIEIPPLSKIAISGFSETDKCQDLQDKANTIATAADEKAVGVLVDTITKALNAGTCSDKPTAKEKIRDAVAATIYEIPETYVVTGRRLTLTVTRVSGAATLTWKTVLEGEARGSWTTAYGPAVVPSDDERYFAKPAGANKFVITKQADTEDYKVLPSIFFSWMPGDSALKSLTHGPTAGFGINDSAPGFFAGYSLRYNQNLGLIAGAALTLHSRLDGKYAEHQELSELIADDKLNTKHPHPGVFVALTFRFSDNPFKAKEEGTAEAKPKATPTAKPSSGTPTNNAAPEGGAKTNDK